MRIDTATDTHIRRAEPSEIDLLAAIDDDAGTLFAEAGIDVDFPPGHEYLEYERHRWSACLAAGRTLLAVHLRRGPVGFAMLSYLDGYAYVEQLSVQRDAMGRGIGTRLLGAVSELSKAAGDCAILLTTYGHLPWNRPFYERNGYVAVPDVACGPEIARELEMQRRWLPRPEQRLAMRKMLCRREDS
jgi:GNAT superfamily N-acetyltransferase